MPVYNSKAWRSIAGSNPAHRRSEYFKNPSSQNQTQSDGLGSKSEPIDRAEDPVNARDFQSMTVGDLLKRYRDTVTVAKRGSESRSLLDLGHA